MFITKLSPKLQNRTLISFSIHFIKLSLVRFTVRFSFYFLLQSLRPQTESNSLGLFCSSVLGNKGWWGSVALFLWPCKWQGKERPALLAAWRLGSTSGLLLGTLKYSWYKYCKALYLIKVPALFNEVTEGSIDQAFCFMPWTFLPFIPPFFPSNMKMTFSLTLFLRAFHNLSFSPSLDVLALHVY